MQPRIPVWVTPPSSGTGPARGATCRGDSATTAHLAGGLLGRDKSGNVGSPARRAPLCGAAAGGSALFIHNPTSFWDPQSPPTSFWDPQSPPTSLSLHSHFSSYTSTDPLPSQPCSSHSSLPIPQESYFQPGHPTCPRGFLLSALPASCSSSTSLSPFPTLFIAVSTFPVLYPWFHLSQSSVLGGDGEDQTPPRRDPLPAPAATPQLLISPRSRELII